MVQLETLVRGQGVRSEPSGQLQRRAAIGAAGSAEQPPSQPSGFGTQKNGGGEIDQERGGSRAHQDVPMMQVTLGDAGAMDGLEDLEELSEETSRNLPGLEVGEILS